MSYKRYMQAVQMWYSKREGDITMSKFKDKFHLLPEQNLFLAKKKLDENIYCGMKMKKLKQFLYDNAILGLTV